MSLVYVQDEGGSKMELVDVDGYYVCTFLRSAEEIGRAVREMKSFKCRPDDIFVCAPMKSGTHWVWEIISMLTNGKAEIIPKSKVKHMLEAKPFEEFEKLPSPRILNTHVDFRYLPADVEKLKCKIVFVLRNPKDVMVSHYNHVVGCKAYKYDGKWENFYRLYVEGKIEYSSWFDYIRDWYNILQTRKDLNIHVVYYEDLKQNTLREIIRIADFLEIENKEGLFEAISKTCQFAQMARDKDAAITPEDRKAIFNGDFNMYRKGEHGDWTNWFTVAQNEHFDKIFKERMAGIDFNFRFLPDK